MFKDDPEISYSERLTKANMMSIQRLREQKALIHIEQLVLLIKGKLEKMIHLMFYF